MGYDEQPVVVGTNYEKVKPEVKSDIKSLKNRFENSTNDEAKKRAEELRQKRLDEDKIEREKEEVSTLFLITISFHIYNFGLILS